MQVTINKATDPELHTELAPLIGRMKSDKIKKLASAQTLSKSVIPTINSDSQIDAKMKMENNIQRPISLTTELRNTKLVEKQTSERFNLKPIEK